MPRAIRRIKAIVSGYVQGVGYRAFVVDAARGLDLVGYVRNLPDGRVEVVAEGSEDALEELLADLRRGPYGASVEGVESEWQPPAGDLRAFSVRF